MTKFYTTVIYSPTNGLYLCPVTNLFDAEGNEIHELEHATSFVTELPNGQWLSGRVGEFTVYRLH